MLPLPEVHRFVNEAADEALKCLYSQEEVKAAIGYEKILYLPSTNMEFIFQAHVTVGGRMVT